MIRVRHNSQQGFSLVEIMVAMLLGVILLGGTITIYASSKDSYRLQENIAGMQENARFALFALRRDVEMAGFPRVLGISPFIAANNDGDVFDANGVLLNDGSIKPTVDGDSNNSDTVTIQYQSSAPSNRDCLGAVIPDGDMVINQYFISDANELHCRGIGNAASQPLVENVTNLQALYGVDSDNDSVANLYVTAKQVSDGVVIAGTPDWDRVVSLRLALLVASESSTGAAQKQSYTLLDAPALTMNDGIMYRVFSTTIPLRNRIP